jgi:hypothetical protein
MADPLVTVAAIELPRLAKVTAQFQPAQLRIDRNVPWQPQSHAAGDPPNLVFSPNGTGRMMSIRLVLGSEGGKASVQPSLDLLLRMTRPISASGAEDQRRPPRVALRFPAGKIPEFTGVIDQLSFHYGQLLDDGTPVLAAVELRVREANHLAFGRP